ncbi:MAG: hypothetical protein IID46_13160, partial [Planctomycetes bacterium]|nr:hypothetical protein [Planctomycetota bacterium]
MKIHEQLPKGAGKLTIKEMELGNLIIGERPWIERMEFEVELTFPLTTDTSTWQTYHDEDFGFEFLYPIGFLQDTSFCEYNCVRLYDVERREYLEDLTQLCRDDPNNSACATEAIPKAVTLTFAQNESLLNLEDFFLKEIVPMYAVEGSEDEVIRNSKNIQIGNLDIITGESLGIYSFPYYFFLDPTR